MPLPDHAPAIVAPSSKAIVSPDWAMTVSYLSMLFGYVDGDYAMMLRGVGEKDTAQEGRHQENLAVSLNGDAEEGAKILRAAERWGRHHIATFIVPAAMHPSILKDNKGTEDRVALCTNLCLDLDNGNPAEAVKYLTRYFASFTMLVASGGITAEGHAKLHVYWRLSEPTDQIAKVAAMRGEIASKVGGDPSFKRAAQVIRVPGTIYGKGGASRLCQILEYDEHQEIHL